MQDNRRHKHRILNERHEATLELHTAGLISKRWIDEFEALCRLNIDVLSPQEIKRLCEKDHVSQAVLAAILTISPSTI